MLAFAIPVLTHDPNFTIVNDVVQLKQIEECLWLILKPLIKNHDFFCSGFYKILIQRIKNHRDAWKPDDSTVNHVKFYYSEHNINLQFKLKLFRISLLCRKCT